MTAYSPIVFNAREQILIAQINAALAAINAGAGGGTVVSVGMTGDGTLFNTTVTGSPVTTTGTFVPALLTHNANTVFAGPSSGGAATPTFRAIAPADLPLASSSAFGAVKVDGTTITASSGIISAASSGTIELLIDGGGVAITTGLKAYMEIPFNCTINRGTLLADQSGSIVVDIWKCTYSQFDAGSTHPVSSDKITGSAPLTISSATKSQDSTLTGWTTSLTQGDVLAWNVNSTATVQRVTASLKVTRT